MALSQAMTDALAALKAASDAAVAKAAADATGPAVDAKDAEDVAAINELAAQINPPA